VASRPAARHAGVLDDRGPSELGHPGEAARAVVVCAREDDADAALAVGLGGRLKQHIDRRARVEHRLVGRQRDQSRLHQQVVVGRREVHGAGLDLVLVAGLRNTQAGHGAEQVAHGGRVGVRRAVLGDHDARVELRGKVAQDLAEHVETAPRRADCHEFVWAQVRHRTFRYSRS